MGVLMNMLSWIVITYVVLVNKLTRIMITNGRNREYTYLYDDFK